jgi:DtxR family transcriptional regulator, Mn-dependent transcriptional regulator
MRISEETQEQLEALWICEEENGHPDRPGNHEARFPELLKLGLVFKSGTTFLLTPTGKVEASRAIRRHRLAERLMSDILATEDSLVDERACTLEHALMNGIEESICTLLGHPRVCPHGKPIPPGRCCQKKLLTVEALIAPINEMKAGQNGRIAYIHSQNTQHLQKLMAMGVLPGSPVRVVATYPSFVFAVGYSQFAVDEEIAGKIFVRLENDD